MDEGPQKSGVNWWALIPVGLFAALIGAFFGPGLYRDDPEGLPSQVAGGPAPAVATAALPGKALFNDATLRDGEVKLVNYWASWCVPCRAEHPRLQELADAGIPIYGVNYKDKPDAALGFLAELGDPYTALVADVDARMGINWGLYGVPETFVIAGDGTVMLRYAGPLTREAVRLELAPAIEAARTKP